MESQQSLALFNLAYSCARVQWRKGRGQETTEQGNKRTLRLRRSIYHALRAHSEEAYPEECCGSLLGHATADGWQIVAAIRAHNASAAGTSTRYEIAPAELVGILRQARREGLEIAGFYHSHPDAAPHWSPTDLREAHWLGASYVITQVVHGNAAQTRSFRLAGTIEEDKHFEPEHIELTDEFS